MRKTELAEGEYYHVYNRGTDKRDIFQDIEDFRRFFQSLVEFNVVEPIGSIYENRFNKKQKLGHPMSKSTEGHGRVVTKIEKEEKLVEFIAYCVNPNHFHFILEQVAEKGIEKFMQRLGNGYTKYFNRKHRRSGVLFQGKYKSIHVDTNEYLLHLSAYVNLNDRVHNIPVTPLGQHRMSKSSWGEYIGGTKGLTNKESLFCKTSVISEQFSSPNEYEKFAEEALTIVQENRRELQAIEYED